MIVLWDAKGGIGSGNWGHAGRKGIKGGSAPISSNSADKIYAGGQKYKQAGGKRSVTEKRKVAYNSKKDSANADSTVSDVSLPKPIDTTPKPQNPNIATYQLKVSYAVEAGTLTMGDKLNTIKILKSKIENIDMSQEDKDILYGIVNKGIKDVLDSSLADAKDLIVEAVKSDNSKHSALSSEIKDWQANYNIDKDDLHLDQSDLDYLESGLNQIKMELTQKINKGTLEELSDSGGSGYSSEGESEYVYGDSSLVGYSRYDTNRGKDLLDSISKHSGKDAVHFYEYEGDWMVNNYLRNGSIPDNLSNARSKLQTDDINPLWASDEDWKASATRGLKRRIQQLDDSMIDELPRTTVLTRLIGNGHPAYEALYRGTDAIGSVYNEANFASTSVNFDHQFGKNKVKVRIKAPAGTRGLSFATDYQLRYPDEKEFLLPRSSAFKIVGMDFENNEVFVELIDNGVHP